ncbi:MAG TPA: hypothetical protein VGC06_22185 [Actinomycetes bacterium]
MRLALIAAAVLLAIAIGMRLCVRVMARRPQRLGPSTTVSISRPRRLAGRALVAAGGLALPLLPLVWIAAVNEPWHETDNDREFLLSFARWFSLAVLGLVGVGILLLSGVGHRRPR